MRGNVCIAQICPAFRPLGDDGSTASPSPPRKTSKILFPILSSPEDSEDELSERMYQASLIEPVFQQSCLMKFRG